MIHEEECNEKHAKMKHEETDYRYQLDLRMKKLWQQIEFCIDHIEDIEARLDKLEQQAFKTIGSEAVCVNRMVSGR